MVAGTAVRDGASLMKMRAKVGLIIAVLIVILGFCLVSVLRDKYGVGADSVWWLPA